METKNLKLPPQALDLEVAVLGAVLFDTKAVDDMFSVFTDPSVFYDVRHIYIFSAIKELYQSNIPVDILTVSEQLKKNNVLEKCGGDFYLITLTQKVSSSAHTDFHCRILLQKYIARKVIDVCNNNLKLAYSPEIDVFELMDNFTSNMDKLSDITSKGYTSLTWNDAVLSIPKRVEFLTNNQGKVTGVPTGLTATDKHFNGWQKQDLIIIGADSGMGKTAFVLNNMLAAAKEGIPVGMFSMEMSVIQLAIRGTVNESNFHMNQLMRNGFEDNSYFDTLLKVVEKVRKYPLFIDDQPALTVQEMKRKARTMKRKNNIELLVIDFVQMFSGDKDIRINISEAARECKNLAKELDIPILALSQVSREVRRAHYNIPNKHHLKESSAIEEAADIIALIYRPGYYYDRDKDSKTYNDVCDYLGLQYDENACLLVAKNRNGALGNVGLHFVDNKTKYINPNESYKYYKINEVEQSTTPF